MSSPAPFASADHASTAATAEAASRGSIALSWVLHAGVLLAAATAIPIDRKLRRRLRTDAPLGAVLATAGYVAVLGLAERRRPFRSEWRPDRAEVLTDIAIEASLLPVQEVARALGRRIGGHVRWRAGVDRLPTPVGVALVTMCYDLFHSQLHRLGHVWGPGWRVHSVHHSVRRLYFFNAGRNHPIELFLDGIGEGAILHMAGTSRDQELAYATLRAAYGSLEHCNVDLRSGVLDRLFSTPDLHRWHHSDDAREGDANYGVVTSLWDQFFGTWHRPNRAFDAELGIGGMPNFPQRFGVLLRAPFRWGAIREANAENW